MKKKIAFLLMFFLMLPNGVFALEENEEQKTNGVEEQTSNSLASEFDEHNGRDSIDNVESNGLARFLSDGYSRAATYIVHGNDGNVYYANNRRGKTFYLNNGQAMSSYKDVCERIDVGSSPIQTKVAATLYKEPAFSSKYRTSTTIPAGYYTAKYVAGCFAYVETNKGNGWITTVYDNNGNYVTGGRTTFLDIPSTLSVSSVNGKHIYQKFIPRYSENGRPGYGMIPKYVTIHNTASEGRGANAAAHANLQYNGNSRTASWHYTVDNT